MQIEFQYGIKLVKALSGDTRVSMLRLLSCGERCIDELLQFFPYAKETVESELAVLCEAKLVEKRTVEYMDYYRIEPSSNNIVKNFLINNRIEGEDSSCRFVIPVKANTERRTWPSAVASGTTTVSPPH